MTRVITALLALAAVAVLLVFLAGQSTPAERVYSVGEVQAAVSQSPRTWIGRTLLVRGWTDGRIDAPCGANPPHSDACSSYWLVLTARPPDTRQADLPLFVLIPRTRLDLSGRDPLDTAAMRLRTLPFVGPLLWRWAGSRTLRVTLLEPDLFCGNPLLCANGVLAQ